MYLIQLIHTMTCRQMYFPIRPIRFGVRGIGLSETTVETTRRRNALIFLLFLDRANASFRSAHRQNIDDLLMQCNCELMTIVAALPFSIYTPRMQRLRAFPKDPSHARLVLGNSTGQPQTSLESSAGSVARRTECHHQWWMHGLKRVSAFVPFRPR